MNKTLRSTWIQSPTPDSPEREWIRVLDDDMAAGRRAPFSPGLQAHQPEKNRHRNPKAASRGPPKAQVGEEEDLVTGRQGGGLWEAAGRVQSPGLSDRWKRRGA